MNTSDSVSQIITWILSHISFYGLQLLLQLETQFPIIGSAASSSERLDFFAEIINMACSASYSKNIIYAIHNIIIMNDLVKQELLHAIALNDLINQYKVTQKVDLSSSNNKYLTNVMPFTNVCTNMNCEGQSLDVVFLRVGHIAHLISMEPCSIYTGTCRRCKCVYGPSSILD